MALETSNSAERAVEIIAAWQSQDLAALSLSLESLNHAAPPRDSGEMERMDLLAGIGEELSRLRVSAKDPNTQVYLTLLKHLAASAL
jgi:hypothetical protein